MEVAVLGAGRRGRTVTRLCVSAGYAVRLYAEDANTVMDSVDTVAREVDDVPVTDRVRATTGLSGALDGADVVVETTDGDTEARRALVAEAETMIEESALIATGDASVSVTAVAAGLRRPQRAVGLVFDDIDGSPLVEVVLADQTTQSTRERAVEFVETLGVVPLVVADVPGLATRRLAFARLAEAIRMVEDGVASVPDIDRAATRGTDARGALARADELGLDTVLAGLEDLADRLGERFEPPELLSEAVETGRLGRTTGEGFYVWSDGEPAGPSDLVPEGPTATEGSSHR